jgi:NAD(P)-dependent dehydrogenase (short-subunit alcohol dehydrogenase family)
MADGGSMLFISGIYSHRPHQDSVVSAASLSAVEGMCRALAIALAPTRVNAIAPALVSSSLFNPDVTGPAREAMFTGIAQSLPAQAVCAPADIGQMATLLMTNPAVTGSTMIMDSGYRLV